MLFTFGFFKKKLFFICLGKSLSAKFLASSFFIYMFVNLLIFFATSRIFRVIFRRPLGLLSIFFCGFSGLLSAWIKTEKLFEYFLFSMSPFFYIDLFCKAACPNWFFGRIFIIFVFYRLFFAVLLPI